MERKRNPGTKVRKIKPETCLKTGMSRRTEILVTATTAAIGPNHFAGDGPTFRSVMSFLFQSK
jgi:hypothetical protein